MAPRQSFMKKFLFEGRVDGLVREIDCSTSVSQVEVSSSQGESTSAPVLLGTPTLASDILKDFDAPPVAAVPTVAATPSLSDVVILDPTVASPAHELARARRLVYESNR